MQYMAIWLARLHVLLLMADFVAEVGDRQSSRRREKDLKASQLPCAPEGTAASTRRH